MARRPATPQAFEQVIRLAIAKVKPPEFQRMHARVAREALAKHLASRNDRPNVTRIVDGRIGASEDSVKYGGIIRYEFDNLRTAALFAMEEIRKVSPEQSGHYKGQWFFMVNGVEVAPEAIPPDVRDIYIVNDEPYSRRLVVGRRADGRPFALKNPPPGFLELARRAVLERFGNSVAVKTPFLLLAAKADTPTERREQMTYPSLNLYTR